MKTNERNIQMTGNRMAGGTALVAVILIATVLLAFTWARPAFAAEEGQSVTITVKAGEQGSVNGKTGKFTETVSLGKEVKFTIECEEGYLIGRVLLNDEPLAADDLKELLGTTTGGLDLEDLDTDLTVEIIFMTASEYEIQKEYGQVAEDLSGDDTTDGKDSQQNAAGGNGTSDSNTDPEDDCVTDSSVDPAENTATDAPDNTADGPADTTVDSADNGSSDNGTDSGDNSGIDAVTATEGDGSDNQDSQLDTTEYGTDSITGHNTSDGTGEYSRATETAEGNGETAANGEDISSDTTDNGSTELTEQASGTANNGTTNTAVQATGAQNETTENSDKTTTDSAKDDSDSTDDGKGDYYDTPKTGDERNPYIWLAICIGGLIMTAISVGSLIRRTMLERDGRWKA